MTLRLDALRERLLAAECDAFFSLAPPVNQYLAGFRGSTSGVIVTHTEAAFLCDFRYIEQAAQQVQNFEIQKVTGNLPSRVGEWLGKLGVRRAALEPTYVTLAQMEDVRQAFGGELKPVPDLVGALRRVKSEEELDAIRAAAGLAESVLADVLPGFAANLPECEAAARIEYEFKKRSAARAAFDTIVLFGPRSSQPHGMPSEKPLEYGDVVLLDCGCRKDGYCSDLTRTYAFGTMPGTWLEEVYPIVLEAQTKAIEAVRGGIRARELDEAARKVISEAGYGEYFGHGLGHGVGIEVHEAPRLNADSEDVLEPGMVVTIEPGIYLPGRGGVRIEDLVVVRDGGCEVLSKASKELRVLAG
jgi:Xaa-Pro aminopeptidase